MEAFPRPVKACLWSYDIDALDLVRDKRIIIFQILNYGGVEASAWLFRNYSKDDISEVLRNSARSEWSKKSLNFWKIVLNVQPARNTRFA